MPTTMIERTQIENRAAAGLALAERLRDRRIEQPVVIALPRGGVPVAAEIARDLNAPLDLVLVRKLGVPGHEELALGAVMDGQEPKVVINEGVRQALTIADEEIARIKQRALREIERRRALYLGGRESIALDGKTVIVVDDGIATGATMRVALDAIRARNPAALVVAVGVSSPDIIGQLASEVDEVVCLVEPVPFRAVGLYYEDFSQVSDAEVKALLNTA